ncbi:MAG: glycoside hydrolase family 88 protein [Clostridia bacterium]|nr:glycoside hydrolase family 88 protein [Clostridia bacterium]
MKNKTPLELGMMSCDSLMNKYAAPLLPPEHVLFYHQGVFLSGMEQIYLLSKERKYFNYIKDYIDSVIGPNGEIYGMCHEITTPDTPGMAQQSLTMLDSKQPVILMYNLYDETGDEKYRNAIEAISRSIYYWPVNTYNGYWHMMFQPHQMWMDGAYMVGPLSAMYSRFGDYTLLNRAIEQIMIMNKHIKDTKSGLYFHAWDPSKEAEWADPETGLSEQIWSRAVAWYAVAILDILDYVPDNHPKRSKLIEIEQDLLKALSKVQDKESGLWYQVLDKPGHDGNWIESSGTCLFVYSYAKAIRKGIVGKEYKDILMRGYNGIKNILYTDDEGHLVLDLVCAGTCVESGSYDHYINCKTVKNDLHGAGAFILMCAEMERLYRAEAFLFQ